MKKIVMLLLVFLTLMTTPMTALASIIQYCKVYISNNNFGTLESAAEVTGRRFAVGGNESVDLMDARPKAKIHGWYFIGWRDNQTNELLDNSIVIVSRDRYFTPQYAADGYTIAFCRQDGSVPSTEMKNFGDSIPELIPSRDAFEFGGWYLDAKCLGERVVFPYTVHGDVTFHAKWTASYDVRFFDENGAQIGEAQQVAHGNYAQAPDDPVKEGHAFAGWNNGTDTLSAEEIGERRVTGPARYTAQFSSNKYDVRFFDEYERQIGEAQQVAHGNYAQAPDDPVKEGHAFAGWNNGTDTLSAEEIGGRQVTGPARYTAAFDTNRYMVTFKAGGLIKAKLVELGKLIPEPNEPTREGYDFAGWLNGEGKRWDFDEDLMPAGDITLNANWDIRRFTVTFYEQDGETLVGCPQTVNWGSAARLEKAPDVTGHTFDGWMLSGSDDGVADNLTNVRENIKAVARYVKDGYTVTFVDDMDRVVGTDGVCYGGGATAPSVPEKEGHTFDGWNACFDYVTENITVQAQYTVNSYIVKFLDRSGGEISVQTVNWNAAATAPAYPEHKGYTFAGWDTAFDKVTSDLTVRARYIETLALDNDTATNDETDDHISSSSSAGCAGNADDIELLSGSGNGGMATLESGDIPAEPNMYARYSGSISLNNRVPLPNDAPGGALIIILCAITVLSSGVLAGIVKLKKR